jgi:hypothetical protein
MGQRADKMGQRADKMGTRCKQQLDKEENRRMSLKRPSSEVKKLDKPEEQGKRPRLDSDHMDTTSP